MGFPLAKECGDYQSLQRAAFLTDYVQSVLNSKTTYSQDTGAALTKGFIHSRANKVLLQHPSTWTQLPCDTKLVLPQFYLMSLTLI